MSSESRQPQETENVWSKREELPKVSARATALIVAICFLSALAIPLGGAERISFVCLAVLFALFAWMVHTPSALILTVVSTFFVGMLATPFGAGCGSASIFLSLVLGTTSCTYLLTVLRRWYLAVLPALAAAAVAALILVEPMEALLSLSFLPASALLAFATLTGRHRTSAICFAAGGFLVSLLLLCAYLTVSFYGDLSAEAIGQAVTELEARFLGFLTEQRETLLATLTSVGEEIPETLQAQINELFSDAALTDLMRQVFHLLPGLLLVLCAILGYGAQALLNATYHATGLQAAVTRAARVFTVSIPAAALYSVSFLLLLILSPSSLAAAVVQNLCLILMPGLCVLGVIRLTALIANAHGAMRVLLILFAASMLFCYPGGVLYVLAMWGAYSDISGALHLWMIKKMVDREKDDGNDSNGET